MKYYIILFLTCLSFFACKTKIKDKIDIDLSSVKLPVFNETAAFAHIEKQLSFGARVPNTPEHEKCAKWLQSELQNNCDTVIVQNGKVVAYTKDTLFITNIMGQINPKAKKRILLCSHWDSRPTADKEEIAENKKKPVPGANDGASGVGILLEISKILKVQKPEIGVDFIFFDAEDYGDSKSHDLASWCLGSQYWGNHKDPKYTAQYAILLDMVGAPNAIFPREAMSMTISAPTVNRIWSIAHELGYDNFFSFDSKNFVGIDDHIAVTQLAKIPCIDIIQYKPETESFGSYWHTLNDNIKSIDKKTLKAVGETLLANIYLEK